MTANPDNSFKKEYLIKNLLCVVSSDGVLDHREDALFMHICKLLSVDMDTIKTWKEEVFNGKVSIKVPKEVESRTLFFDIMISACKADGIIQKQEMKILKKVAVKFGVEEDSLVERIKTTSRKKILAAISEHEWS